MGAVHRSRWVHSANMYRRVHYMERRNAKLCVQSQWCSRLNEIGRRSHVSKCVYNKILELIIKFFAICFKWFSNDKVTWNVYRKFECNKVTKDWLFNRLMSVHIISCLQYSRNPYPLSAACNIMKYIAHLH